MKNFILGIVGIFLLFLLSSSIALAHHRQDVLGEATEASNLSIPATSEGPGIILPNSPLFFLDELKQNLRLILAFNPETRSKVHAAIAGERLAELQFMLDKNNTKGIRIALLGVSDNFQKASENLTNARLSGRDVKLLAKAINESIKEKRDKLSVLEENADLELKAQVKAAREALKVAKVEVEDSLSDEEIEHEIEENLELEIEEHVKEVNKSNRGLERAINVLERLASEAAQKEQTKREEALRKAIEVKNEALMKQHERLLELEKKKQHELFKMREEAKSHAKEALKKSLEASLRFKEAQKKASEIESKSITDEDSNSEDGSSDSVPSDSTGSINDSGSSVGSDRSGTNSGQN